MGLFNTKNLKRILILLIWIFIIGFIIAAPYILPQFRLNLLGRYLSLAIVALGVDLIWGYTGLLSLGQGIFFALGGYCAAMYLQIISSTDFPNGIPKFFGNYDVIKLPFFWEPFNNPFFTLIAIWLLPALVAGILGYIVFRNRIKGVYFSILTQASLLVFFNFFNGQQKLINGTNGLKTDVTELFGKMVGSDEMQKYFFWLTAIIVIFTWFFSKWLVKGRFGNILIGIRDDEPRVRFSGYNPVAFKTIIFAIAGGLAGISGALYTVQSGIVAPSPFLTVAFSIEMVIWVAVGGRGTLLGAIIGAVVINYAKSLISEKLPGSWLFFQGGLFIFVVTILPEGILGWINGQGPRNLLQRVGIKRRIETYPSLEINNKQVKK